MGHPKKVSIRKKIRILKLAQLGYTQAEIAAIYNLSQACISRVINAGKVQTIPEDKKQWILKHPRVRPKEASRILGIDPSVACIYYHTLGIQKPTKKKEIVEDLLLDHSQSTVARMLCVSRQYISEVAKELRCKQEFGNHQE